ncbi:MAG: hypothetical protein IPG50_04650 [Myxococcales bacterium]|nr:hypothetical protein [Myxococcales bacterium]
MATPRHWRTACVIALLLAVGGAGAAYVVLRQADTDPNEGQWDLEPIADASPDARAGRKTKPPKKGSRKGKPSAGGGRSGGARGVGGTAGGIAGGSGNADGDEDPSPVAARPFTGRGPAGPTYEAAIASNKRDITIGTQGRPDLTDVQLSGPMRSGRFVGECGAPDSMKVTVKVAIKLGRPVGVSVTTSPSDPDVAGCVDRYVRTFSWPSNANMDSFTTTY